MFIFYFYNVLVIFCFRVWHILLHAIHERKRLFSSIFKGESSDGCIGFTQKICFLAFSKFEISIEFTEVS